MVAAPSTRAELPGEPAGSARSATGTCEVPPAVVALLAGRPDRDGFRATLLDLAARGWFRLRQPGVLIGKDAMELAGPVMCVLAPQARIAHLLPHERRVAAYLSRSAAASGEVSADVVATGVTAAELRAFSAEVTADALARGLMRRTRRGLGFGPKAARLGLSHTPAGRAALAAWRADHTASPPAAAASSSATAETDCLIPGPIGRDVAYAAALGAAPLAPFAHRERHRSRARAEPEFDGRVLRKWEADRGMTEGIVQYVVIDDGARPRTLRAASHLFEALTPGALVHVRVDPRRATLLTVRPLAVF